MKAPRVLLLAVALAAASPALAQTTGSESCTTLIQSAANAASSRVSADDTDIPKPQSVKNFTCLDKFFNGTGLNVVVNLLKPDKPLERRRERDLQQADLDLAKHDRQGAVRDHPYRLQDGFPRRQHARRRPLLPEDLDRRRRPDDHVDRRRKHEQRQNLDHRQRRRPDRVLHHIPSWPLLRAVSMPKSRFLLSSASGVLVGALVFGSSPKAAVDAQ